MNGNQVARWRAFQNQEPCPFCGAEVSKVPGRGRSAFSLVCECPCPDCGSGEGHIPGGFVCLREQIRILSKRVEMLEGR